MKRLLTIAFVTALSGGAFAQSQTGDTAPPSDRGLQGPQDMPQGDTARPMNAPSGSTTDTVKRPELAPPSEPKPTPSDTANPPLPDNTQKTPPTSGNPGDINK